MTVAFIDGYRRIENAETLMLSIETELERRCSQKNASILFCGYGKMESIAMKAVARLKSEGKDIETVGLVTNSENEVIARNYDKIVKIKLLESVAKEYEIACKISYIISQADIILTARYESDDKQSPLFKLMQSLGKEVFTFII